MLTERRRWLFFCSVKLTLNQVSKKKKKIERTKSCRIQSIRLSHNRFQNIQLLIQLQAKAFQYISTFAFMQITESKKKTRENTRQTREIDIPIFFHFLQKFFLFIYWKSKWTELSLWWTQRISGVIERWSTHGGWLVVLGVPAGRNKHLPTCCV